MHTIVFKHIIELTVLGTGNRKTAGGLINHGLCSQNHRSCDFSDALVLLLWASTHERLMFFFWDDLKFFSLNSTQSNLQNVPPNLSKDAQPAHSFIASPLFLPGYTSVTHDLAWVLPDYNRM